MNQIKVKIAWLRDLAGSNGNVKKQRRTRNTVKNSQKSCTNFSDK
ncbi:hypothetical protein ANACOL_01861 [Anaerotruncus colihominis DSM 17241]|uniref:Uncharacterized protein n=1 Tax=Anaerotruncus colihominis DSM 17241 TaxID=445972 RepID=B0PAR1_9FIRM|nr:hypothetical protein ANACOL_01861 [Anaerotruncus colihominis DSM 17241]DAO20912.1 MAG TPA: hypothetical protein [Caudoviricetes sp.]